MDSEIMSRCIPARAVEPHCVAATLLMATGAILLWPGCTTASRRSPAAPVAATPGAAPSRGPEAQPVQPEPPAATAPTPAVPARSTPAQPAPATEAQTVGPEAAVAQLTMLVESEPAGATIVVDGRPMGKTPLRLGVPATPLGFFRDYVEIRARFIAGNETEITQTATEEFSPREKVPTVLLFTPTGARRTVR